MGGSVFVTKPAHLSELSIRTICIGVPATTDYNLNKLNNSRQGVTQLSFMEETNKIQVRSPLLCLFQGDGAEPDAPSPHRMEATVVPLPV